MSARRDDEDLADLLDELETTLSNLRSEVDADRDDRGRSGRGSEARPPRPPSMRDLLRFTEEYTIPAIVTLLEANIRALKATQRVLRMRDPERAARGSNARDRLDDAGRTALSQLERSLTDLSDALSAAELPADPESREIVADARSLTAEIEDRIADAQARRERGRLDRDESVSPTADDSQTRSDAHDRGIAIDVREEGEEDDASATATSTQADDDAGSETDDVEAELQSIKDELGQHSEADGEGVEDEPRDSSDHDTPDER